MCRWVSYRSWCLWQPACTYFILLKLHNGTMTCKYSHRPVARFGWQSFQPGFEPQKNPRACCPNIYVFEMSLVRIITWPSLRIITKYYCMSLRVLRVQIIPSLLPTSLLHIITKPLLRNILSHHYYVSLQHYSIIIRYYYIIIQYYYKSLLHINTYYYIITLLLP